MMRMSFLFVLCLCLCQPAWAQTTADPIGYAYAKFSPMLVSTSTDVTSTEPVKVDFGTVLPVLEVKEEMARIILEDAQYWVRKADIFRVNQPDLVEGQAGFSASERPAIRMWSSVSTATEFLEASNVRNALPDFQEVLTGQRLKNVRLPVVARDTVDVMGSSSVTMAAVMIPISRASVGEFDKLRGAQSKNFELTFVVDASPDAVDFSVPQAETTRAFIARLLQSNGDAFTENLVFYGAQYWDDVKIYQGLNNTAFEEFLLNEPKGKLVSEDPLLAGLETAANLPSEVSPDLEIVFVFAGSQPKETYNSRKLSRKLSLANPGINFSKSSHVIFVQATPEPSPMLKRMTGKGIGAESFTALPFNGSDRKPLLNAIRTVLGADKERPIPSSELREACKLANVEGFPCIFPFSPTTRSKLPGPPRRARSADWYSMVAWVVLDGLILK